MYSRSRVGGTPARPAQRLVSAPLRAFVDFIKSAPAEKRPTAKNRRPARG